MKTITLILLTALMAVGCSRSNNPEAKHGTSADGDIAATDSQINSKERAADEVLVKVNGRSLMLSEALSRMSETLGPPPANMPAARATMIRNKTLSRIVDDFVSKALLIDEAERRNIQVTAEEQQQALDKITAKLPEGQSLDSLFTQDGDREAMLQSMTEGIKVQKLLGQLAAEAPAAPVTDEDIDAYLTSKKQPEPNRDEIRAMLKRRHEMETLATFVRTLQSKADISHSTILKPPAKPEDSTDE